MVVILLPLPSIYNQVVTKLTTKIVILMTSKFAEDCDEVA